MKASLQNYRQSPRKVRLVADLIKGKKIEEAMTALDFLNKRASLPIKKLVSSAVANALNKGANVADLFVKEIRVDKGIVMKRFMPRAMGRASRINKRTSHVLVVLGEKITKATKKVVAQKEPKKVVPKVKAKGKK